MALGAAGFSQWLAFFMQESCQCASQNGVLLKLGGY
jgi:hypothetical protein